MLYFTMTFWVLVLSLPSFIHAQNFQPTIFWDPASPVLLPEHWSKVINVEIYQTLTFLCPNNDVGLVPFQHSNTKSFYNLYMRKIFPNDTQLNYDTVCDPTKSHNVFSCNQTRNTHIDFAQPVSYKQLVINTEQPNKKDPKFDEGMDYIFFSTSDGSQNSLRTSSTKCTMVFRIHFCPAGESCSLPLCSTFGREEACVRKSSLSNAPINVTVDANTTSSLNVSWNRPLNMDNAVAYYSICYRTNTSQSCQSKIVDGDVHTVILDSLNPATEYFIRARAFTCKGPGDYSAEVTFKTQELPTTTQPPTPARRTTPTTEFKDNRVTSEPNELSASSITSSSVNVTWKLPDFVRGELTYYSLCARPEHNGSLVRDCRTTIVESAQLSAVVHNLEANTSYGIRVRAYSCKIPGDYSQELMVKTAAERSEPPPESAPQSTSCSESTIDSVSVVIGLAIGVVATASVMVLLWMVNEKRRKKKQELPKLMSKTNRAYRSSVSGANTLDKNVNVMTNLEMNPVKSF